ncbi:hypothetical protein [Aquabacterium sp.]|uniref:hypothetical protein n=1 Tax=Aquabacterium sp. TaxID=1872578 RepID=UPI003784EFD9
MHALLLSLFLLLLSGAATAQANYTKTAEIEPLRTSFNALQGVLTKASTLVSAANLGVQVRREELAMKFGVITVTVPGHDLVQTTARVPEKIDSLTYSYSASEPAKISRISVDLADYKRTVTVEGPSPEQVDAIFAVLREDLQVISTPLGGTSFRSLFGFPAIWLLMTIFGWCGASWYARRTPISLSIALSAVFLIILLMALLIDELLSGFWAVNGEPSFMVRYGPHMSFIGFLIAVVGVPFMVLQVLPQKKVESVGTVSPGKDANT